MDFRTYSANRESVKSSDEKSDSKVGNGAKMRGDSEKPKASRSEQSCGGCKTEDEAKKKIEEKVRQYSTKSESELTDELMRTANKMKSEGKLNAPELENLYSRASGFLDSSQLEKLRALIDMIK